jgi:hypothetical protein
MLAGGCSVVLGLFIKVVERVTAVTCREALITCLLFIISNSLIVIIRHIIVIHFLSVYSRY